MNNSPIKILLSQAASKRLTDTGADAFVVVSRASHPAGGRWVVHPLPRSTAQGDAGVRVAQGLSAERKTRRPKASK